MLSLSSASSSSLAESSLTAEHEKLETPNSEVDMLTVVDVQARAAFFEFLANSIEVDHQLTTPLDIEDVAIEDVAIEKTDIRKRDLEASGAIVETMEELQ